MCPTENGVFSLSHTNTMRLMPIYYTIVPSSTLSTYRRKKGVKENTEPEVWLWREIERRGWIQIGAAHVRMNNNNSGKKQQRRLRLLFTMKKNYMENGIVCAHVVPPDEWSPMHECLFAQFFAVALPLAAHNCNLSSFHTFYCTHTFPFSLFPCAVFSSCALYRPPTMAHAKTQNSSTKFRKINEKKTNKMERNNYFHFCRLE